MNNYHDIPLSNRLDDVIEEGVKQAMKVKNLKKQGRYKRVGMGLAAGLVVTLGVGFTNPAAASKLPVVGNVFETIEKNLYFPGNYSEYATSINETAYSNGIGITLSEILSDGQFLYVTYIVESDEPFENLSYTVEERGGEVVDVNQLILEDAYTKVDFKTDGLEMVGISGLEGKFIDEHTFIGVEQYYLGTTDVPDEFIFQTKKVVVENYATNINENDQTTWGTWAFKVPVTVNQELTKVIDVEGFEQNGASVHSIAMTPFGVIVEAGIPDEDWSKYDVWVYDEDGNQLNMSQLRYLDHQEVKGIYNAPQDETATLRVIIEKQIWVPIGEDSYTHNESDVLLDAVISVK